MSDILNKVRKLNWLLQESPTGAFSFNEMCGVLSDLMDSNVYVLNAKGRIIGASITRSDPTASRSRIRKQDQRHFLQNTIRS